MIKKMSKLNDRTEDTKKVIHLLVTSLCSRNCKYCCNKQYDLNSIKYVTDEELKEAHTLCITGGEPFMFANPCTIAEYYKVCYPNIKNIYVYTNAYEFALWLKKGNKIHSIDGLNISIKTIIDMAYFENYINNNEQVNELKSNLLYVFEGLIPKDINNFKIINREWQKDFEPVNDSIFRRC